MAKGLEACVGLGKADLKDVQRELAAYTIREGDAIPLRELCNIVHSLSVSKYASDSLMNHVSWRMLGSKSGVTVLDANCFLHALAMQSYFRTGQWYSKEVCDFLVGRLTEWIDSLEPRQYAAALWSLGVAGHYDERLFALLLRRCA